MKKIFLYTPEFILALAVIHSAAAVLLGRAQGPTFTDGVRAALILAVVGALSCWQLAVMLYASRPWFFSAQSAGTTGKRPDTSWITWSVPFLFVLPGLGLIPVGSVLLSLIVHPTAYEPRVMLLILAWAFTVILCLLMLTMRRHPGPARRVTGPLRAWHLALVLLVGLGAAAWPLATWNPTLRHATFALRVKRAASAVGLTPGEICRLEVGWFPGSRGSRCKLSLHCGSQQLYGGYKKGVFDCAVLSSGLVIQGHDDDSEDGDPALWIDTVQGTLQLATSGRLPRDAVLELELLLEADR